MNSLEYDVDAMGGLMPQILALTAPPGNRDNKQQYPQQKLGQQTASTSHSNSNGNGQAKPGEAGLAAAHPYFRRPGRGHNHDCCDACSEGGDLICCDLCPASFHLTCHDPPLDEDEIPTGEWACHQCRMGGNEDDRNSCSSGKSNKSTKGVKRKDEAVKKVEQDKRVCAGGREIEVSLNPLSTLIKAASVVNPTQFTLPYEMMVPVNFPGEPKELLRKNGARRGPPKKKPYELDNGLVPLPAKICFQCNKSCRVGPLIPCDFCPLFYHLDCLDPPLTTPPMGRWMCPNHPEHHMDTTLLASHSLTERIKLWDKFSVPLDQDSVKLSFFQRCHRTNPPFRYKVKKALRSRLRVPAPIKAHYQDPPDLLPHLSPSQYLPLPPPFDPIFINSIDQPTSSLPPPSLKNSSISLPQTSSRLEAIDNEENDLQIFVKEESGNDPLNIRIDKMENNQMVPLKEEEIDKDRGELLISQDIDTKATKEEREQWLTDVVCMHSSILRHIASKEANFPKHADKREQYNGINNKNSNNQSASSILDSRPNYLNGDFISHETKVSNKMCLDGRRSTSNHMSNSSSFQQPQQASLYFTASKKGILKTLKSKLSSTPILKARPKKYTPTEIVAESLCSLQESLKKKLEETHGVSLSNLDHTVVETLALERLRELLEPQKPVVEISTPPLPARALVCPLVPDIRIRDIARKSKKYCSDPVPMPFRVLNIGKGSHNHVNLELYGHCNYISEHHASVIFDETTGHYELLNYSEYSSKVDSVSYHSDFNEKTVSQAASPPFLQQVRNIIAQRRNAQNCMSSPSPSPRMSSRPGENLIRCECHRNDITLPNRGVDIVNRNSGWEGAAVLHHGSYMRFGCLQFVFSIVEEASKGDWSKDTAQTYERFMKKEEEESAQEKEEKLSENEIENKEKECKDKKGKKDEKCIIKS